MPNQEIDNNSQQILIKSEELFSKAFHSSPTIMTIASLDDERYIEVNQAYEKATGYYRFDVIGKKVSDIFIFSQNNLDGAGVEVHNILD